MAATAAAGLSRSVAVGALQGHVGDRACARRVAGALPHGLLVPRRMAWPGGGATGGSDGPRADEHSIGSTAEGGSREQEVACHGAERRNAGGARAAGDEVCIDTVPWPP